MNFRNSLAGMIATFLVVAIAIIFITVTFLYSAAIEVEQQELEYLVRRESVRFASMMRFAISQGKTQDEATDFVINRLRETDKKLRSFGKTGEIVYGKRVGDRINILLTGTSLSQNLFREVPMESPYAEPMHRALHGETGWMLGRDYDDVPVFASYGPVEGFPFGIVVKLAVSDFRRIFIDAALEAIVSAALLIFIGYVLFRHFSRKMRKKAETDEKILEAVLKSAIDGIITIDTEGVIQSVNASALAFFGYAEEELIGENVSILIPEHPAAEHDDYIKEHLETGRSRIIGSIRELEGKRKDNTLFPIELSVSKVETREGVLFVDITRDISTRKKAEQILEQAYQGLDRKIQERTAELSEANKMLESEVDERRSIQTELESAQQRLVTFLECSADWCWELDSDMRIQYLSPNFQAVIAIDREKLYGLMIGDALKTYVNGDDFQAMQQLLATQKSFSKKCFEVLFNDHRTWFEISGKSNLDAKGNFLGFRGSGSNVTERIRSQKKIAHFASFPEANPNPVMELDLQGRVLFRNKKTKTLFPDIGTRGLDHPLLQGIQEIIRRLDAGATAVKMREIEIESNVLQQRICLAPSGDRILVFSNDITARKQAEEERAELERELAQHKKMESLGTLSGGIAHELNTPIQYVSDNLRFLAEAFDDFVKVDEEYQNLAATAKGVEALEKQFKLIQTAEEAADMDYLREEVPKAISQSLEGAGRVAHIVRAIKEFSHPDSQDATLADLNQLIETTLTVTRSQWKYVAEVDCDFDRSLNAVPCYPGQLNQVILNLVINAAQAIEENCDEGKGRIRIATRCTDGAAEISITDNGGGIPVELQERIFEPFFTTKEPGKGTGQGLSICHSIIAKKHQGQILLESDPGVGSTFTIRLPLSDDFAMAEAG